LSLQVFQPIPTCAAIHIPFELSPQKRILWENIKVAIMPNIAKVLREEISRISRHEAKVAVTRQCAKQTPKSDRMWLT